MAWAHIQSNNYPAIISTTQSCALAVSSSTNSLIVLNVGIASNTVNVSSVYDNVGNTYTISPYTGSASNLKLYTAYGVQLIPGATTCSFLVSGVAAVYKIIGEFSGGVTDSSIFDTSSVSLNASSCPPFSCSQANDLIIASCVRSIGTATYVAPPGFTIFTTGSVGSIGSAYNLTGSVNVVNCTLTSSFGTRAFSAFAFRMKPLGGVKCYIWSFDD